MKQAFTFFIAVALQATILHGFALRGGAISLLSLCVTVLAVRLSPAQAVGYGAIAGFFEDSVAGTGIAWTLATMAASAMCAYGARVMDFGALLSLGLFVSLITILRDLLFFLCISIAGYPSGLFGMQVHIALWSGLITGAVALALIRPLQRAYGFTDA